MKKLGVCDLSYVFFRCTQHTYFAGSALKGSPANIYKSQGVERSRTSTLTKHDSERYRYGVAQLLCPPLKLLSIHVINCYRSIFEKFSRPTFLRGSQGQLSKSETTKNLDPLPRVDAQVECHGETNEDLQRNRAVWWSILTRPQ